MIRRATVTNALSAAEPNRLVVAFIGTVNDLGASAAAVLNEAWRRRLRGEPDPAPEPERFDFTKPPPGHYRDLDHPGYVRQGHGKLRLLADAWVRWKTKRDPPGAPEADFGTADNPARRAAWTKYEAGLTVGRAP